MRNTSLEAYEKIVQSGVLTKARFQVYSILFDHGPLTQNEAEEMLENRHGIKAAKSGHKRFSELERQGAICIVGEKHCSVTGNKCKLWDVTANVPVPLPKDPPLRDQLKEAQKTVFTLQAKIVTLEKQLPAQPDLDFEQTKTAQDFAQTLVNRFVCGEKLYDISLELFTKALYDQSIPEVPELPTH